MEKQQDHHHSNRDLVAKFKPVISLIDYRLGSHNCYKLKK
jgi:hypothetical protein